MCLHLFKTPFSHSQVKDENRCKKSTQSKHPNNVHVHTTKPKCNERMCNVWLIHLKLFWKLARQNECISERLLIRFILEAKKTHIHTHSLWRSVLNAIDTWDWNDKMTSKWEIKTMSATHSEIFIFFLNPSNSKSNDTVQVYETFDRSVFFCINSLAILELF